jgi:hypothetical protein
MIAFLKVHDIERCHGVTWGELVELEPGLAHLWWQARQAGSACRNWADARWIFALVRRDLATLVGLTSKHHRHPVLGTVGAFDVAYWRLFDAVARRMILHDCREDASKPAAELPRKDGTARTTARAC